MFDVRDESCTHPKPFPLDVYHNIVVLAPHPDDEIYGCGGLLVLARELGIQINVVILTDGSAGSDDTSYINQRKNESLAAAGLIGYAIHFASLKDRSLRVDADLLSEIRSACSRFKPDLVLAPSLDDPHPDHQAVSLAAMQVLGCIPYLADLAFYETNGGLTHVSHIANISRIYAKKRAAMECFVSQDQQLPYSTRIEARDTFRAFTLGPDATHAETFFLASLQRDGFQSLLPVMDPLFRHGSHFAVAHPSELETVSVLIRTIGDPQLEQAIACVLAQTYRPVEIIIICAHAADALVNLPHLSESHFIQQIIPSTPLDRPAAANAALKAAKGRYLVFLDDDDLLLPHHLQTLLATLHAHPEALAAYSYVAVQNTTGHFLRQYDFNVTMERLLATNLLPIHSVLFDRKLIDFYGCQFDEELPRLEDWDFWLQVAQHTGFVSTKNTTAIYRYRDRTGLFEPQHNLTGSRQALRMSIMAKWRNRLGNEVFDASLAWYAGFLDEIEQRFNASANKIQVQENLLQEIREQNNQLKNSISELTNTHQKIISELTNTHQNSIANLQNWHQHEVDLLRQRFQGQFAELSETHQQQINFLIQSNDKIVTDLNNFHQVYCNEIVNSSSWRMTVPFRWMKIKIFRRPT